LFCDKQGSVFTYILLHGLRPLFVTKQHINPTKMTVTKASGYK